MDLDGNAASCTRNPPQSVEMAAQLRSQSPCISHCFALQIRLRRPRSCNIILDHWFHYRCQPSCLTVCGPHLLAFHKTPEIQNQSRQHLKLQNLSREEDNESSIHFNAQHKYLHETYQKKRPVGVAEFLFLFPSVLNMTITCPQWR